jgi:hypothetical protein
MRDHAERGNDQSNLQTINQTGVEPHLILPQA